jgi:hypothetical protein
VVERLRFSQTDPGQVTGYAVTSQMSVVVWARPSLTAVWSAA